MIEEILQKRVVNGSVPSLLDKPNHDKILKETTNLHQVFYTGDKLSNLENDIERMYVSEKLQKHNNYQRRKSYRYKVKFTTSDFNKY